MELDLHGSFIVCIVSPTETVSKVSCKGNAKFLFPEYEVDMEPEELEERKEKTEEEVMQEYEALLRSGRVTRDLDDGEILFLNEQ